MNKSKCTECGGEMVHVRGQLEETDRFVGTVIVEDVEYIRCEECGDIVLPFDTCGAIDRALDARRAELLGQFPRADFICVAEACQILGMKDRRNFHQNGRIRHGFIYSLPRGNNGERDYLRSSVERFAETQDGRFPLCEVESASCADAAGYEMACTVSARDKVWLLGLAAAGTHLFDVLASCEEDVGARWTEVA